MAPQIASWTKDLNKDGAMSRKTLDAIAQKVSEVGDLTTDTDEKFQKLNGTLNKLQKGLMDGIFPVDADVDPQKLQEMTDSIQSMARSSD
jgi:hypothetical protein